MRTVLVVLISVLCAGCFAFDELDKGMEIMEAHTPADQKKQPGAQAAEAAKTGEEKPPTYNEAVAGWFENAKTLGPRKQGGDNPMVQCKLGGGTRFTKRTDCLTQGGEEV